jgi:glycine hydroxymethyltransferase
MQQEGIVVNKNTIPFDTRSPIDPSGIRIGTAAETTRGKTVEDMKKIGNDIDRILRALQQ